MIDDLDELPLESEDDTLQPFPQEDPLDTEYYELIREREKEAADLNKPQRRAERIGLGNSLGIN
jgi:hypothetical protein